MARMQKTLDRAQDAVRTARDEVAVESRETAASLVERVGGGVRRQSQRAARATERAGDRIGGELERRAERIRAQRSPVRRLGGYLVHHPLQTLLLLGLMTGVVALIAVPMLKRDSHDEYHGFY